MAVSLSLGPTAEVPCVFGTTVEIPGPVPFVRGDANADGQIDISDGVNALVCLFVGEGSLCPLCMDAIDVNDSGTAEIADPVTLLNYLFTMGPPPAPPHPGCGLDTTEDELRCEDGPTACIP